MFPSTKEGWIRTTKDSIVNTCEIVSHFKKFSEMIEEQEVFLRNRLDDYVVLKANFSESEIQSIYEDSFALAYEIIIKKLEEINYYIFEPFKMNLAFSFLICNFTLALKQNHSFVYSTNRFSGHVKIYELLADYAEKIILKIFDKKQQIETNLVKFRQFLIEWVIQEGYQIDIEKIYRPLCELEKKLRGTIFNCVLYYNNKPFYHPESLAFINENPSYGTR
jgi:hypothetical protein